MRCMLLHVHVSSFDQLKLRLSPSATARDDPRMQHLVTRSPAPRWQNPETAWVRVRATATLLYHDSLVQERSRVVMRQNGYKASTQLTTSSHRTNATPPSHPGIAGLVGCGPGPRSAAVVAGTPYLSSLPAHMLIRNRNSATLVL
jgi:hypothetical protein